MYRFHHVKSAKRLLAFFTSTYLKQSFPHNALLRCLSFKHSSHVSDGFIGRKVLPPELSRNVVRLTCKSSANEGVFDVYLVGTIHRFHHVKSTKRLLLAFFTSTYPKQSFHHNALLRCLSFKHLSHVSDGCIGRKVLPPELSRNVVRLTCKSSANGDVCDVYLVGTIHQTPESCQEVKALINFLKPQVVFLELCSDRAYVLEPVEVVITEFQVAYEEAKKYGGKVILGDRPMEITFGRMHAKLANMPSWQYFKMVFSELFQRVVLLCPKFISKKLQKYNEDSKMPITIRNVRSSQRSQILVEIFADERDQYMSAGLLEVAREHNSVVAVVGRAHLPGIQKYWKKPIEVKQLSTSEEKLLFSGGKCSLIVCCSTSFHHLMTITIQLVSFTFYSIPYFCYIQENINICFGKLQKTTPQGFCNTLNISFTFRSFVQLSNPNIIRCIQYELIIILHYCLRNYVEFPR